MEPNIQMLAIAPIFKDKNHQSFFEENGFVKVSLLPEAEVDKLVSFFNETKERHSTVSDLHHTTTDTQDKALILEVDEKIKSVFIPELEKILVDFKALVATYHIKEGGKGSATGIHQDPTFVDESIYCSANVWVALHDIDEQNGNLFFVRGSNWAVSSIRAIPSFPSYYQSFRDELPNMVTQVALKKGEAVIFNNATIHGATENLTDKIRLAATLLVCSNQADWLLYYADKASNNQIEKYHLDLDAFISMPKGEKPNSDTFVETMHYIFPQISHQDFLRKVKPNNDMGYMERIKNIFRRKSVA